MSTRPVAWIALFIASALCIAASWRFFPEAFPLLNLDVSMSREQAIAAARERAAKLKLADVELPRAAAQFGGDGDTQVYVELTQGNRAYADLVARGPYQPYRWTVRLFEPGRNKEVQVSFTPSGSPVGFWSKLPEAEKGAALDADWARRLALDAARAWNLDLSASGSPYRPLDASVVTRSGGRVDHAFTYERSDVKLGEASIRVRLAVSGDRLTEITHFVHIPETFQRRYAEMRSANNTIGMVANYGMGLLYGIGGCVLGLVWLVRSRAWVWKPALGWAVVVAGLQAAAVLSGIPVSWIGYDTAIPETQHVGRILLGAAAVFGGGVASLTLVFSVAESLGRRAFPAQPQLWRLWGREAGHTRTAWGNVLGGYAWIGFDLAFILAFYFVTHRYFGWWSPSDSLVDPNILARSQAWVTPVANALQAGFMEECLFRAIPLAGAALLGERCGRRGLFIAVALVVQAIVFGAAHAPYPTQPSYARPVELLIPSLVWGLVYLRYGLLPGIVFHFGFDLVLMAMPLFVTDAAGIGFDRFMVIAALLAPLAIVAWRTLRARRAGTLPDHLYNGAWRPPPAAPEAPAPAADAARGELPAVLRYLPVAGVAGLVAWLAAIAGPWAALDAPRFEIGRTQAISAAEAALAAQGVRLGPEWRRLAMPHDLGSGAIGTDLHAFVWKEGGRAAYSGLIGNHLAPPAWEVRFARFEGSLEERAEEWRVYLTSTGAVRNIHRRVPEERAGPALTREEARAVVARVMRERWQVDIGRVREISAQEEKLPGRTDWTFLFADPARKVPAGGEARLQVSLAGDSPTAFRRYVFVPEEWNRERRAREAVRAMVRRAAGMIAAVLSVGMTILAIRRVLQGPLDRSAALLAAVIAGALGLASFANGYDSAALQFSTSEPWAFQLGLRVLGWTVGAVAIALLAGTITGAGVATVRPWASPAKRDWLAGAWLGGIVLAAAAGVALLAPGELPNWPDTRNFGALWPWLDAFAEGMAFFVSAAAVAIGFELVDRLTARWTRRRMPAALLVLAWTTSSMLALADTYATGIAGGLLAGALLLAGYAWVFRLRPQWLIPTLACAGAGTWIERLVGFGHPSTVPCVIAGLAGLVAGIALWLRMARRAS